MASKEPRFKKKKKRACLSGAFYEEKWSVDHHSNVVMTFSGFIKTLYIKVFKFQLLHFGLGNHDLWKPFIIMLTKIE